jgi:hypothetical protein
LSALAFQKDGRFFGKEARPGDKIGRVKSKKRARKIKRSVGPKRRADGAVKKTSNAAREKSDVRTGNVG